MHSRNALHHVQRHMRVQTNTTLAAGIIDEEKPVKHTRLSQRIEEALTDPAAKCQVGVKTTGGICVFNRMHVPSHVLDAHRPRRQVPGRIPTMHT